MNILEILVSLAVKASAVISAVLLSLLAVRVAYFEKKPELLESATISFFILFLICIAMYKSTMAIL